MTGQPRFHEEQRFRQVWIWVLLAPVTVGTIAYFAIAMYRQLVLDEPFGYEPSSDLALALIGTAMILLMLGLLALFAFMTLQTRVDDAGVGIRFWPWKGLVIPATDIVLAEAIDYRPIRSYGGWGMRRGRDARAYTVSGSRGVIIERSGGDKFLVGSQRADELAFAIRSLLR